MDEYDCIVVGAGPAGLVAALRLTASHPSAKVLVLEKCHTVGGRTCTTEFAGRREVCGAGVGRQAKDARLALWMQSMNLPVNTWTNSSTTTFLPPSPYTLADLVTLLRSRVRPSDARRTFAAFAQSVLSPVQWAWFKLAAGFTDYCDADAYDTVMHYGFDDLTQPLRGFTVPWTILAAKTMETLKRRGVTFKLNAAVVRVLPGRRASKVVWHAHAKSYVAKTRALIVATPVTTLRTLFPLARAYRRDALDGQPFLRLYATLNAAGRQFMARHVHPQWREGWAYVPGPLQKVGVIDQTRGVYRLGYADNLNAVALRRVLRRRHAGRLLTGVLRAAFGAPPLRTPDNYVSRWKACEWFPVGTHFYRPLPLWCPSREAFVAEAQRPVPGCAVWVVGEAVSFDQGWTEGALSSVDAVWGEVQDVIARE